MARLSATSREPEEWANATDAARATRAEVADQLRSLVVEADRMGSRGEMTAGLQRLLEAEQRIAEAVGRQQQAEEEGLPIQPHREAEKEGRMALRSAAMNIGVAAGTWVASLDHELAPGAALQRLQHQVCA